MRSPKPYSIGRIILYVPTPKDIENLSVAHIDANRNSTPLAAIIVNDWPGLATYEENGVVNLQAFLDGRGTIWGTSVHYSQGKEPGTWHWPEIK